MPLSGVARPLLKLDSLNHISLSHWYLQRHATINAVQFSVWMPANYSLLGSNLPWKSVACHPHFSHVNSEIMANIIKRYLWNPIMPSWYATVANVLPRKFILNKVPENNGIIFWSDTFLHPCAWLCLSHSHSSVPANYSVCRLRLSLALAIPIFPHLSTWCGHCIQVIPIINNSCLFSQLCHPTLRYTHHCPWSMRDFLQNEGQFILFH